MKQRFSIVVVLALLVFLLFSSTIVTASSFSEVNQEQKVEKMLVNFQNTHLLGVDYTQEINYPFPPRGVSYYTALGSVIISLTKDSFFVVSGGSSEGPVFVTEISGNTLDAINVMTSDNKMKAVGEVAIGKIIDKTPLFRSGYSIMAFIRET